MGLDHAYYDVRRDCNGEFYWVFIARNGEPIARSSESYVHREDCLRSIQLAKQSSDAPVRMPG